METGLDSIGVGVGEGEGEGMGMGVPTSSCEEHGEKESGYHGDGESFAAAIWMEEGLDIMLDPVLNTLGGERTDPAPRSVNGKIDEIQGGREERDKRRKILCTRFLVLH